MIENNFIYGVVFNHYGSYSCEDSGCNDENICRCYSIHTIEIKSINITLITESIFNFFHTNDSQHNRDKIITSLIYDYDSDVINRYAINRILTINKVWDVENWTGEKSAGYYGDEVEKIILNESIFNKVIKEIEDVFKLDTLCDKINFLLNLEYGYILDKIKGKNYQVITVDREDLDFIQQNHHKKVVKKKLEYYSDQNYKDIPRGIAYWNSGKWVIIDGYHRLTETKFPKVRIIGIK